MSPSGRGLEELCVALLLRCAACRPWRCFFATTLEPLSLSSRPGSKHAGRALGESSTFKRRPGMGRANWYLGEWRWIRHLRRVMRNLVDWFALLVLEFPVGVGNEWHVSNALLHASPNLERFIPFV